MGKAARRRRIVVPKPRPAPIPAAADSPRDAAFAALARLLRANKPGRLSLAGAYALGYAGLGYAQREGETPDWFHDLDPLDTLMLGTVWPFEFHDGYEFGITQTGWLRLLRTTAHWTGIERFVREVVEASDQHDLGVDDGELMLLVVGRLEQAGLDQRKLPAALLPRAALAGSRAVNGPDPDLELPAPPGDGADRLDRFWAGVEVALSHDGTPIDALREGLHLFGNAGVEVREDSAILLPALYAALVAAEDELVNDAFDRAPAWAYALPDTSPLIPIVDAMIIGAARQISVDDTLGHLLAVAAFTQPVPAADRTFTAAPGIALAAIAFELGYPQVLTRDGKAIRVGPGGKAALDAQVRAFERKFGRPPEPDEPIFFDPDADEPQPMPLVGLEQAGIDMLTAAGICDAWMYAYQHTDGLLPRPDGSFNSDADRRDWDTAVARFLRTHSDQAVDQDLELAKLRAILALTSLRMAATDPAYGASLAHRLDQPDLDDEADVVADYLLGTVDRLTTLHRAPGQRQAAAELARAWAGADLADRLRQPVIDPADLPALLALATSDLVSDAD
jgi:hypothetical protein